ncbi:MAG: TMEM165/GDT1 family protein [Longicatena sp.]
MFLHTFLLVFIAEMADKTQFMIMALTNRFRIKTILMGMISGIIIIAGLSVLAGDIIGDFVPVKVIKICGGVMFLLFGLWNLRKGKDEESHHKVGMKLPIISIALSFILAELGDKTQLATVALAADHMQDHLAIFAGSAIGLILANIVGIFAGKFIFSKLPEDRVKLISSCIFFFFGSTTLFEAIPGTLWLYASYSILLTLTAYVIYTYSRRVRI